MTRYEYDEMASAAWRMDVVHEIEEAPADPALLWVEAMRRLNAIDDELPRRLLELHRDCGSGTGVCDGIDVEPAARGIGWGCDTTALIADHYRIEFPRTPGT